MLLLGGCFLEVKMIELTHQNTEYIEKEETNMAAITKPNEANIIRDGMLAAFAQEVRKNIPDKKYWDECEKSKTLFSSEEITDMKNLCKGQKK